MLGAREHVVRYLRVVHALLDCDSLHGAVACGQERRRVERAFRCRLFAVEGVSYLRPFGGAGDFDSLVLESDCRCLVCEPRYLIVCHRRIEVIYMYGIGFHRAVLRQGDGTRVLRRAFCRFVSVSCVVCLAAAYGGVITNFPSPLSENVGAGSVCSARR